MPNPLGENFGDVRNPPEHGVVVDADRYPLVIITLRGQLTDAQLEAYLAYVDRLPATGDEPGVMVFDLSDARVFTATQRKRQADWIKAQRGDRMSPRQGVAFIIRSAIVRGAVRAVFWLADPSAAVGIFATREEALAWAHARMTQTHVQVA